jgi:hypothetical protein
MGHPVRAVIDPDRLGGLRWAQRTRGDLSPSERRRLLGAIVRGQGSYLASRVRHATGRVPAGARTLDFAQFSPPDSRLARLAEEAANEQSPAVRGHGYRTWAFGSALAALDQARPDPELFYVAALLHDYGCDSITAGEDFVLRSAERAAMCAEQAGSPELGSSIGDAICVHPTAGITVDHDGAEGFYVQAGASFDLAGIRCGDLPHTFVGQVHDAHARGDVTRAFIEIIRGEATANPRGRFAQLRRCGFNLLLRANPIEANRHP